jgi:hypothetical protein
MMVGDLGLQATAVGLGDAVAEHGAQLIGAADTTIEVQQALSQVVESRTFVEDEVGAILDLARE